MSRSARRAIAAPILAATMLGTAMATAGAAAGSTVAGLWHMNNHTGTVMYDSSGQGHNGTLHNVTLGATGVSGYAYTFNGRSSYVWVPSAGLNPGSANVSISFYLNTTHLPKTGDYDLVRKGAYPAEDYKVELLPAGQIKCTFQGSAGRFSATGGSGLNNGAWHHIQCVKTASRIQTVVDGTVVATTNAVVGSISNTSGAEVGAHPGSDWYNGKLDELSIAFG